MKNLDPFDYIFNPPYGTSIVPTLHDSIDEAIGIIESTDALNESSEKTNVVVDSQILKGYAFIAMPINPNQTELDDVLDSIKNVCDKCGLNAERIDEAESNERITDRILASIQKAEFVIVDLTNSRPNVFYEAGYAQGLGKTPIYIAKEGTQLEFDLKDYPIIFFKTMRELGSRLEDRLRALSKNRT